MNLDKLTPGPIRYDPLAPDLVSRVSTLCVTLAEVFPMTKEEWLDVLQRDLNPSAEVLWWQRVADCFSRFAAGRDLPSDRRQAAFNIIFGLFSGIKGLQLQTDLDKLSESELSELLATVKGAVQSSSK